MDRLKSPGAVERSLSTPEDSATTTRSPLLRLPFELLILISRYYLYTHISSLKFMTDGRVEIDVTPFGLSTADYTTVRHNPKVGFYDGKKPKLDALNVFLTSKRLCKAARAAAVQVCHVTMLLRHNSFYDLDPYRNWWRWTSTNPGVGRLLVPILPIYLVRSLAVDCTRDVQVLLRHRISWEDLRLFMDTTNWPRLETIIAHLRTRAPDKFYLEEVGDLLRGKYDERLKRCWMPTLPQIGSGGPRELYYCNLASTNGDTEKNKSVTIEVHVTDSVGSWIHSWNKDASYAALDFMFVLRGKNFEELNMISRTFCCVPYETPAFEANGTDWEEKALIYWPEWGNRICNKEVEVA